MKNHHMLCIVGLLLAGTVVQAVDPAGLQVGGGLAQGLAAAKRQAGMNTGFGLFAGYGIRTSVGDVVLRPGLGITLLSGSNVEGVKADADALAASGTPYIVPGSSLKHDFTVIQAGVDAMVPIFDKKANLVLGLTANKYSVKVSGAAAGVYSPVDLDAATRIDGGSGFERSGDANGTVSVKSVKVGIRFGVEYHITERLDARVMLNQTELGRNETKQGQLPTLQPFWAEVGVVYRF